MIRASLKKDGQVMIVADDSDILLAAKITFELAGQSILTASGGEECIEMLERGFRGGIWLPCSRQRKSKGARWGGACKSM